MADIGGTEYPVEVSALETVGPEIDYDGLVAHRPEGIDDIDLPGPQDAFVLILGALRQWVILVLRSEIFAPDASWIADAVLPMQHQQCGFRRYSFDHALISMCDAPWSTVVRFSGGAG